MKEDERSRFRKTAVALVLLMAAASAVVNIKREVVPDPGSFLILIVGFILFLIPKLSVIVQNGWIGFGTSSMTEEMANLYRLGYCMMILGILLTFP